MLDPSKNIVWFRNNPITILKEKVETLGSHLQQEVNKLQGEHVALVSATQTSSMEDEIDRIVAEACGSQDKGEVEDDEVLGYFAVRLGECASGRLLNWWKVNEARFPKLANVARKYAGMPATSSPSERIISQGRQLINDFRHLMRPDLLNAMLPIKSWYELLPDDPLPLIA